MKASSCPGHVKPFSSGELRIIDVFVVSVTRFRLDWRGRSASRAPGVDLLARGRKRGSPQRAAAELPGLQVFSLMDQHIKVEPVATQAA